MSGLTHCIESRFRIAGECTFRVPRCPKSHLSQLWGRIQSSHWVTALTIFWRMLSWVVRTCSDCFWMYQRPNCGYLCDWTVGSRYLRFGGCFQTHIYYHPRPQLWEAIPTLGIDRPCFWYMWLCTAYPVYWGQFLWPADGWLSKKHTRYHG